MFFFAKKLLTANSISKEGKHICEKTGQCHSPGDWQKEYRDSGRKGNMIPTIQSTIYHTNNDNNNIR